jgi:hypothetical protein
MHLVAERFVFFFWVDDQGFFFFERGSQCLSNGTNVASYLANFFCLSIYSPWTCMNEWGLKFFDNKNKERRKNVKQVIPVESYPAVYTESSREALSETARGARLDQDAGRGISFPCHFGCMIRYGAGF